MLCELHLLYNAEIEVKRRLFHLLIVYFTTLSIANISSVELWIINE